MNTQSTTKINSVIIIGGGAAGMLAAISASELGKTVTVIEKNKFMGKKLNITGKGRCNITNNCEVRIFLENVPVNPKFLYRALTDFSPSDTINFFESNGLETKTERGRRVFPLSDKAFDVTTTLQKICAKNKVKVIVGEVFDLIIENNVCIGAKYKSNGETCTINGDAVILATGGASYPKTGSDGFGYELARRAGHTIVPIKPSLVPLESVEKYCAELMGLSLKNVKISFFEKDKLIYSDMGEMLFTHFGVSGPMILSASAYIKSFPVQMNIDLKPALDERTLENRIINDFLLFKNKVFENSLDKLLPKAMIPVFVRLCG
ncbi:MAG: aminoacetone oxidase family FAD-binding enzyme, partial [Clostridia bacterium]